MPRLEERPLHLGGRQFNAPAGRNMAARGLRTATGGGGDGDAWEEIASLSQYFQKAEDLALKSFALAESSQGRMEWNGMAVHLGSNQKGSINQDSNKLNLVFQPANSARTGFFLLIWVKKGLCV